VRHFLEQEDLLIGQLDQSDWLLAGGSTPFITRKPFIRNGVEVALMEPFCPFVRTERPRHVLIARIKSGTPLASVLDEVPTVQANRGSHFVDEGFEGFERLNTHG